MSDNITKDVVVIQESVISPGSTVNTQKDDYLNDRLRYTHDSGQFDVLPTEWGAST